jgi:hypothetical protein
MKDVVLLAVSVYLLKQDLVRASRCAAEADERPKAARILARTGVEVSAN